MVKELQNLGWNKNEQAWEMLIVETGEIFLANSIVMRPGFYEIAGKTYRR